MLATDYEAKDYTAGIFTHILIPIAARASLSSNIVSSRLIFAVAITDL